MPTSDWTIAVPFLTQPLSNRSCWLLIGSELSRDSGSPTRAQVVGKGPPSVHPGPTRSAKQILNRFSGPSPSPSLIDLHGNKSAKHETISWCRHSQLYRFFRVRANVCYFNATVHCDTYDTDLTRTMVIPWSMTRWDMGIGDRPF